MNKTLDWLGGIAILIFLCLILLLVFLTPNKKKLLTPSENDSTEEVVYQKPITQTIGELYLINKAVGAVISKPAKRRK